MDLRTFNFQGVRPARTPYSKNISFLSTEHNAALLANDMEPNKGSAQLD